MIEKEAQSDIERPLPACNLRDAYPAAASQGRSAIAGDPTIIDASSTLSMSAMQVPRLVLIGMDHHFDLAGMPQQTYDLRVKPHGAGAYKPRMSATVIGLAAPSGLE